LHPQPHANHHSTHPTHSTAGHWLFCNRRWLSPSHPPDRARLDAGYDALCADFPAFAACPRHHFIARLAHVSATWTAAQRRVSRAPAGLQGIACSIADLSFRPPPGRAVRPPPEPLEPASAGASPGYEALGHCGGHYGGHFSGHCGGHCGDREEPPSPAAAAIRVPHLLNPSDSDSDVRPGPP
jgi:hypothetical protein